MKRLAFLAAAALVVAACQDSSVPTAGPDAGVAPVLSLAPQQGPLADRYIVVFKPSVADVDGEIDRTTRGFGAQVHYRYYRALKGFAATLPAPALEGLSRNPNVEFIEADGEVSKVATQFSPPSWGLDRIDQQNLPLNSSYLYDYDGTGVHAYIIDTGIWRHSDFSSRIGNGYDFVDDDSDPTDCDGHGTHVAGTVGGSTYGVAKNVMLHGVRVLNCSGSGSYSGVIAGMDWVTKNHLDPAVANMSLGGSKSTSINLALANSVAAGVVYAVAAGNESTDACRKSPASAPEAITVGATDRYDSRPRWSNYGSCLDLFAPGVGIRSSVGSASASESWSGTSMATPHVAGVAALYLDAHPTASPAQVTEAILANATPGVVGNAGRNSPNLLLYSLFGSGGPTDPPPGETVAVHVSALDGAGIVVNKKFWKASVTVTVVDASGNAVSGATVSASFAPGGSGSCTTSGGSCTIQSGNLSLASVSTTTFTVDGIAGTGLSYDSTKNVLSSTDVPQP